MPDKPDPGTALGLALIARERRDMEVVSARTVITWENFLAEKVACLIGGLSMEKFNPLVPDLSDDDRSMLRRNLPRLAWLIIDDRLTRPEAVRLVRSSSKYPVLELTAGALTAHFRKLESEVLRGR